MSGFCALAIKSTLIPPITTFKREEKGKKWLEGLQENVSKSSLLCLVTFPALLKALSQCLFWIARHKFVQSQPEKIKISCLCCFLNYACWQPVPMWQVGCYSRHTGMLMVSLCDIPGLRNIQALVCKKAKKMGKSGQKNAALSWKVPGEIAIPCDTLQITSFIVLQSQNKQFSSTNRKFQDSLGTYSCFFSSNAGLLALESLPSFMLTHPIANGFQKISHVSKDHLK